MPIFSSVLRCAPGRSVAASGEHFVRRIVFDASGNLDVANVAGQHSQILPRRRRPGNLCVNEPGPPRIW